MSAAPLPLWLDASLTQTQGLVVEGPPGIGKTHLLSGLIASAQGASAQGASVQGRRILRAQPAEAEVRLVGSALLDLCDDVSDAEIDELPPAQAAALSVALLRSGITGALTPQAVALAFTTLVRRLAERGPVLIFIDDVQWLDPQTAEVLAFAARRLPPAGVGLLIGMRTEPGVAPPELIAELGAALPLTRFVVGPMPPADLEDVVRARLGRSIGSSVLRAAVEAADGNPLFGIEVARAMLAADSVSADRVPFPSSLGELVGRHVSTLAKPTRLCLAAASALRKPSVKELRDVGVAGSLAAAEEAGLITINGHDVLFTHPLYAAAAYDGLLTSERMDLHSRLARVVEGEEERARHLALGAVEADDTVAAALDVARDRALGRGALQAALDASRLALRATPDGSPDAPKRLIQLGRLLYRLGDTTQARNELMAAVEHARDRQVKARALHELARIVGDSESEIEGSRLELQALELAGDDVELLADIHMGLALTRADDWAIAVEHARTALELLDGMADAEPKQVAAALAAYVGASFYVGTGADIERCLRAVELEAGSVDVPVSDRALSILFYLYLWTDDFPRARAQLDLAYRLAVDEGDEASRGYILSNMARLELRSGNWPMAEQHIHECLELFHRSGNQYFAAVAEAQQLWLDAYRGDYEAPLAAAAIDIEKGAAAQNPLVELRGRGLRGYCQLVQGDAANAAVELDRYRALFAVNNAGEPALRQVAGEHIEALVAVGRLDDPEAALDDLVEAGTRLGRTAVLAAAARAEALLHAARGDADAAIEAAELSLALYDTVERRFDRARALLTKGQIHRRFKQKSAARRDLTAALEEFTVLGAAGFAERARDEVSRVGLRPAASLDLTETERQIAELTARGMTSAEIAGQLFLSTKTVSANLTRIYRKLGVRNRSELAAQMRGTAPIG
ncbi:LuxR C-terminal-related transcriptional regulator [Jatrophihabitans sp.]|uniref:helix-turn-helix transcriptional regulator n=1 Tax=Jatrophihabitans sp. TaxID=1932789 RepID=UPI0030C6EA6F|nr:ATPase,transcriptional regulator, luxR family [Jatrophihabitans sp.]